jgi:HAD superfamily hydrolase (TIGR01509 family)
MLSSSSCTSRAAAAAAGPRRCPSGAATPAVRAAARSRRTAVACRAQQRPPLKAVIWDCDGVLLESEELHRTAYNSAFAKYNVRCPGDGKQTGSGCAPNSVLEWSTKFYDVLQNTVGGGKPKMRWYFAREGWPTSAGILPAADGKGGDTYAQEPRAPQNEEEETLLVDELQDFKSAEFRRLIASGEVPARPGVLRLMDEARASGLRVAVCSAATRESCVFTVQNLLGEKRFAELDVFMAGDDVPRKKPDPLIYNLAAEKLGLHPDECVVIEDSMVGLNAALGAKMRCVITTTASTADQAFPGAALVVADLERAPGGGPVTVDTLRAVVAAGAAAAETAAAA